MDRSRLLAYLIGAGVAGTLLVFPYVARALWGTMFPELLDAYVPIFLLPLVWGLWNWRCVIYRTRTRIAIRPSTPGNWIATSDG